MKRHVVHQSINTAFGSYKSFSRTISAVFGQKKHTKFRKFRINLRQKSRDCILLSTNNYSFVCNGYKAVINFKKLRVRHFHRLWKTLKYEYCLKFWKNAFDVLVFHHVFQFGCVYVHIKNSFFDNRTNSFNIHEMCDCECTKAATQSCS